MIEVDMYLHIFVPIPNLKNHMDIGGRAR